MTGGRARVGAAAGTLALRPTTVICGGRGKPKEDRPCMPHSGMEGFHRRPETRGG